MTCTGNELAPAMQVSMACWVSVRSLELLPLDIITTSTIGGCTFAVLALLTRRLGNDEVVAVACDLMERGEFDDIDIGVAISKLTDDLPSEGDVERVRARLATHGWPFDEPGGVAEDSA